MAFIQWVDHRPHNMADPPNFQRLDPFLMKGHLQWSEFWMSSPTRVNLVASTAILSIPPWVTSISNWTCFGSAWLRSLLNRRSADCRVQRESNLKLLVQILPRPTQSFIPSWSMNRHKICPGLIKHLLLIGWPLYTWAKYTSQFLPSHPAEC